MVQHQVPARARARGAAHTRFLCAMFNTLALPLPLPPPPQHTPSCSNLERTTDAERRERDRAFDEDCLKDLRQVRLLFLDPLVSSLFLFEVG
jgi:hypothetical protein